MSQQGGFAEGKQQALPPIPVILYLAGQQSQLLLLPEGFYHESQAAIVGKGTVVIDRAVDVPVAQFHHARAGRRDPRPLPIAKATDARSAESGPYRLTPICGVARIVADQSIALRKVLRQNRSEEGRDGKRRGTTIKT